MAALKTHRTRDSVDGFLSRIADPARQADLRVLLGLMRRATGEEPELWSNGTVGFGTYQYKSSSGQEGEWFPVGFASRKVAITVYLGLDVEESAEPRSRLGKYRPGKGCIYIKRLSDVDEKVLEQAVSEAYRSVKKRFS